MIDSVYRRIPGAEQPKISAFLRGECAGLHRTGGLFSRMKEWDTKHFGVGVGSIDCMDSAATAADLGSALAWLRKAGAKCVMARPPASDTRLVALFEDAGFRVMDCLVTFGAEPRAGARFEEANTADARALSAIAAKAFTFDHFHADPRFPKKKSDSMFADWAADCLRKKTVLVERTAGGVGGFVTCGLDPFGGIGRIDLIAVKKPGMGTGGRLLGGALSWFRGKADFVLVGTQATNPAMRLYCGAGLKPLFAQYSMHLWM